MYPHRVKPGRAPGTWLIINTCDFYIPGAMLGALQVVSHPSLYSS